MEKLKNTLDKLHEMDKFFRNTEAHREQSPNYSKENQAHNRMTFPPF